ncbi:MAG: hypothetical protein AAGE80_15515 [Pseudomonadota bacterium]
MQSPTSRHAALLLLRVTLAGLLFWWGLAKGLDLGVGARVSDKYYGGVFSIDLLLIVFGWAQVAAAALLAIGLFRAPLLLFQLVVNVFVAAAVWQSLIDPFWLWTGGEKPETVNALFYPSAIVAAGSFLLLSFRNMDSWALDRVIGAR